jgi:phosphoglucosamine mutase
MRRLFGTDGVRGVYGDSLTLDLVERIGIAFARWRGGGDVLVGRDTRVSGPALETALAQGLAAGGATALLGGVLPTPAVALLSPGCGAVLSASHNPPEYNGVKLFAPHGRKLTDAEEAEIERHLDAEPVAGGSVARADGLAAKYTDVVCERFGSDLGGLRVVLDCANGALSEIAPAAFARLGADVRAIAASGDGSEINVGCGATDLALLARTVPAEGADLGLAFDGDGDRVLAVDALGSVVDGDQIIAILALHLGVDLVAVTVMTNAGFHELMAERGIRVVTTDVGDRYVLEALAREGGVLGGEQSGHVILLDGHTTGDGLAAALVLCRALAASGSTLAEAAAVMPRWAQSRRDVRVRSRTLTDALLAEIDGLSKELAGTSRVLVRPSGTEPVVRVLVESRDPWLAETLSATVSQSIERELG